MPLRRHLSSLAILLSLAAAPAALADTPFTTADIEAAQYDGGDLPSGRSALTAKVQVLLDRSGVSPGVIDGFRGGMSESAIMAFERRAGLPMDGRMDPHVWNLLQAYIGAPLTMEYTITPEDAQGLVDAIPADYAEKAKMSAMAYTSIAEKLGERFHMDEKFIHFLNPGVELVPGATIQVTVPAPPLRAKVTRIIVDKATRRVAAYDAKGQMIVDYPATVGSDATPSPSGDHKVVTVAMNPNYTYNPARNFKQGDNDRPLLIPPGPNGPVGTVWIDLSKPSYGIHGTPTPSQLFRNQSNGCVRLTNWDAEELARMVQPGVTTVEFLEPGVTIADVTGVTQPPVATPEMTLPQPEATQPLPDTPGAAVAQDEAVPVAPSQPLPQTAPANAAPAPDSPMPASPMPDSPMPDSPMYEDTTEELADQLAPLGEPNPEIDRLMEALTDALPIEALPPAEGQLP
ncbi:L,D-transpeptidase family protein [Paracoccus siganidrum]|nr:L,D-transpeptidase [Paracoccus siganidrum]